MADLMSLIKEQITIKSILITIGLVALVMFGRSTVVKHTEVETLKFTNDSLRIELREKDKVINYLDSINSIWSYEVDSLKVDNEVKAVVTKRKKKKRYDDSQKMSYDSAIVARNILLDSAINAQRRIREAESDSSN